MTNSIKSVFRYPGGKAKLLNVLMPYFDKMISGNSTFCDAFVGGGSCALAVANKYPDITLYLNDKDKQIFSFWKTVSSSNDIDIDTLCQLVNCVPTIEMFYQLKQTEPQNEIELAFRGLFFNRTSFSGINKTNSSPIGGKEQKSKYKVNCRYNAPKLIKSIKNINQLLKNRTIVSNLDINDFLPTIPNEAPTYLDPPYIIKGSQLYQEYMTYDEHKKLSEILKNRANWLLSYDNCDEIKELYDWAQISYIDAKYSINGIKNTWKDCKEVLIQK